MQLHKINSLSCRNFKKKFIKFLIFKGIGNLLEKILTVLYKCIIIIIALTMLTNIDLNTDCIIY